MTQTGPAVEFDQTTMQDTIHTNNVHDWKINLKFLLIPSRRT